MEVFKPIKVENYQFMESGLDQYEPLLLYIRDDVEEGKVYFVKNKFDDKLREWVDNNLIIEGRGRAFIDRSYGKIAINVDTQDLENSIAELSAEVQQLRSCLEEKKKKSRNIYNLMERIGEINHDPYMTTGESLTITNDSVNAFVSLEEGLGINELEERIEKLEEGFRKIELKNEREKKRRVYNLMSRIEALNKDTIWIVVDDPSKIVRLKQKDRK